MEEIVTCIDLSHDSLITSSDHPSGLCTVCREIDFVSSTSEVCCGTDNRWFHIGTLQAVMRKEYCPGCRLILSAASGVRSVGPIWNGIEEMNVTIRQSFPSAHDSRYPIGSLREKKMIEDDATIGIYENPIEIRAMENLFDVILQNKYEQPVAGNIIRAGEVQPADLFGSKSTIFQSEESFCVRGRIVSSEVNISLIKDWMQSCSVQHKKCRSPILSIAREQNIRLVDVQDYRIVSATPTEKYVALSYVWGPTTLLLLVQNTISQFSFINGLKHLIIPRTISDAIQLVKDIGQRYLWVDSLCIVQDDNNDKQQQLPIMDSIFSDAELVVVVAAGSDANSGIPGIQRYQRGISQRIEIINGTQFITTQPPIQQALKKSVWSSRGWTFQEAILARRALVFTENLVYWNCQVETWREDITYESSLARVLTSKIDSLKAHLLDQRLCRTQRYCQSVETISQRTFKEKGDIIWALIGVLKLHAPDFQKGYIWAHPYERLDSTLIWYQATRRVNFYTRCSGDHPRHARHVLARKGSLFELPYPSWSWLSTSAEVSFMDPCGASIVSAVTWHEPIKLGYTTSATYLKLTNLRNPIEEKGINPNKKSSPGYTSEKVIIDYGLLCFTAQTATLTVRRAEEEIRGPSVARERTIGGDISRDYLLGRAVAGDGGANEDKVKRDETDGDETDGDEIDGDGTDGDRMPSYHWTGAAIYSPTEERIGTVDIPLSFFNEKSERSGEFVLLSSNAQGEADEFCKELAGGCDVGSFNHVDGCRHIVNHNIMLIEWHGDVAFRRGLTEVEKSTWEKVETQAKKIILG
ncbi:MAG: hypothetical protein LQ351_004728 [Letrouitia transgressa]|nr:MAG: hypothetical protein LQ351_004728 [Letrouitia transgressa]